jgi:hypothetical protein
MGLDEVKGLGDLGGTRDEPARVGLCQDLRNRMLRIAQHGGRSDNAECSDAPEGIDGRNLRPLLEGESLPEEPAYMEAVGVKLGGGRIAGARTGDWKLIKPPAGRTSLYRLDGTRAEGVDEKHNLLSRHPEVARSLEVFIEEIQARGADQAAFGSGMTTEEEAIVEKHLRELGYL